MIGKYTEELLRENQENFIVPAENVATLLYSHPLEHALLILSKVGYAKIPVLDTEDRLVGLIGLSDIVNKMMGLTGFDYRLLEGLTVADVMEVNVPTVLHKEDLEDILHLLVDGSFLPVVDEDNIFEGIITRKEVLKSVNHLVHELERRYTIEPKSVPLKNK
ncbi:cyclic-di-AMP-binding protein CbpB [Enterococcus alcedinis]|uniref:CBS domain-containing protein n=1 Tax=Enterococcus alcedinis TaxID=1274384 RepID=A0A917JDI7_9ENTE|nr:cyclic-di-AMP-binding protein CbpB [Enterococcus alcedinis]MBP2100829.1 CBS domain-containing protein [Enterococcus alcedinis]GGI64873.1 CBS domain-containing protein [Enterococcus alcedinis]